MKSVVYKAEVNAVEELQQGGRRDGATDEVSSTQKSVLLSIFIKFAASRFILQIQMLGH